MVDPSSKAIAWVEYPETDGDPMTESDATRNYLIYCVEALRLFFQSRPRIYVSGNLFIYYQEFQPEKKLSPDVFVVFGVSKRERRGYETWREGASYPPLSWKSPHFPRRSRMRKQNPNSMPAFGFRNIFSMTPRVIISILS